ncbi:BTAD domain-containing putative transcriptional regulator [Actinokineospora sp. 24-640]
MRFGVLGPLAVWTADGRPVAVPERKVRLLLAALLVRDGRPVPPERLVEDIWGAHPPGNPANTLQTKVSQLRRALAAAEPGAVVEHRPGGYALAVADSDVREFRALLARAAGRVDLLGAALALWRGPVLADVADEPFAVAYARELDGERLTAVEDWALARLESGDPGVADDLAAEVARHPLRERLRGLHMRALYEAGRQVDALNSHADLRRALAEDLGLEPGPALAELHQAILSHRLPTRPRRPRTNLPAPVAELVGRAEALRQVDKLLTGSRLVTLTGPGGVGKTSLALEAARQAADSGQADNPVPTREADDGVWLVELAGLDRAESDPADAVARVLGVRGDSTVTDAVRGRRMLLVLDNCERVVDTLAPLVSTWLGAAPGLRVLATSQESLGLAAETLYVVPPLEVPDPDSLTGEFSAEGPNTAKPGTTRFSAAEPSAAQSNTAQTSTAELRAIGEFSAVRLFLRRAGLELTASNARAVGAVCLRLDGLPLALELAATRVRALGVDVLLERLDDRFRLLDTGHRDAPARQRTLRAMIDWSWDVLPAADRAVLRRLAVHVDGCALDAAEAVCAGAGVEAADVLGLLARLVDRSLVVGGPRFRLLESVAEYSRARLAEAGEDAGVRLRHAEFHLGLAERADPLLRGADQREWLHRLDADAANLRLAVETFVDLGAADEALRLVDALAWYWFLRGRFAEGRRLFAAALALPGGSADARAGVAAWAAGFGVLAGVRAEQETLSAALAIADPAPRARACWFLGYVQSTVGDMAGGERLTSRAAADFAVLQDDWGIAAALIDGMSHAMTKGDLTLARTCADRATALFDAVGDRWGRLQATFTQGVLAQLRGDYERAAEVHRAGLGLAGELELWPEMSYTLSWLGRVALLMGDIAEADAHHERARAMAAEYGCTPAEMYAETGLALADRRAGRLADAERRLHRILAWHRDVGFEAGATLILAELGFVAELRGDAREALRYHQAGLAAAREVGDPRAIALATEGLAGTAALAGDHERAARLLGTAAAARASVGVPLPPAERGDVDRVTATATAALGEPAFTAAHTAGSAEFQ